MPNPGDAGSSARRNVGDDESAAGDRLFAERAEAPGSDGAGIGPTGPLFCSISDLHDRRRRGRPRPVRFPHGAGYSAPGSAVSRRRADATGRVPIPV